MGNTAKRDTAYLKQAKDRIAELDERLRVQDQWRKELETENQRLKKGVEDAKYTLLCPVSGSVDKAVSILAALEGGKQDG